MISVLLRKQGKVIDYVRQFINKKQQQKVTIENTIL